MEINFHRIYCTKCCNMTGVQIVSAVAPSNLSLYTELLQRKWEQPGISSDITYWISPASICLHLICLSPCKRSCCIYFWASVALQWINEWGLILCVSFFSEHRRASGGLSLEELRRNMQFSPIDRNGLFAEYTHSDTVYWQLLFLKVKLVQFNTSVI